MKLSRTAGYAVHVLVYLGARKSGPLVTGAEAAKDLGIPEGFLLRIMVSLARAKVLTSIKGPHGGYRLGRPAQEITLLDVIESVEGPFRGEIGWSSGRLDKPLGAIMGSVADQVRKQLSQVTIADLNKVGRRRSG
ncbi:hypothetical protein AYO40_00525 [Planctomycetaceae bacterium SCGC AG-212-D15]|nr:hypothetical protein AYO40_00525 [Planctomycetaceae bacterium SCGC AG-212-D15]